VAVGGDGTMNEVAQALVGKNTALGIIPRGSGNGLARHLYIPTKVIPAISVINTGKIVSIDTLLINGRSCISMAGIGFDGFVSHLFAAFGKRGLLSYARIVLREFKKYKPQKFEITANGKTICKELFLVSVANSSQFGNNAYIAPLADIKDGLMEICMLSKIPALFVPWFIFKLFSKKAHESKYLEIISTAEASIKTSFTKMHIDGEPCHADESETKVRVLPGSLKIVVPADLRS
jgi:YegS/Rv2252/BmrU family lipid kinase